MISAPPEMPRSDEAEQGLLSCLLNDHRLIPQAAADIAPECFYHAGNRLIFTEIMAYCAKTDAKPLNIALLSVHLLDRKLMEQIGGPSILAQLLDFTPVPAHYPHFQKILKDKLKYRQIVEACEEMAQRARSATDNETPMEILGELGTYVCSLESETISKTASMQELVAAAIDRYELAFKNKGQLSGVSTGFQRLDAVLGGLVPKSLYVVAGSTSDGKSALALQLAVQACDKCPVALYTFEMPDTEEVDRIMAHKAQIGSNTFRQGLFTHEQCGTLTRAASVVSKLPLVIRDVSGMKLAALLADMRLLHRRHGIKVFVIDYLQLVKPNQKGHTREREVADISSSLKEYAKILNCAVIALSQLNQQGRTKEASAITEDADCVMTISVPKTDPDDEDSPPDDSKRIVFVSKNRNGERYKKIEYAFDGKTFTFTEQP